jgi:NADH pyrophosphatase NudC (nudix superfamily)
MTEEVRPSEYLAHHIRENPMAWKGRVGLDGTTIIGHCEELGIRIESSSFWYAVKIVHTKRMKRYDEEAFIVTSRWLGRKIRKALRRALHYQVEKGILDALEEHTFCPECGQIVKKKEAKR